MKIKVQKKKKKKKERNFETKSKKDSPSSYWDIGPNIIKGYDKKIFSIVPP